MFGLVVPNGPSATRYRSDLQVKRRNWRAAITGGKSVRYGCRCRRVQRCSEPYLEVSRQAAAAVNATINRTSMDCVIGR
jgi:hypothetical protein